MSNRHSSQIELDAAQESVMAVGVRRTTFSDIARRAGISRMTLYRRYPDLQSLLAAMMTRELSGIIQHAVTDAANLTTARERLVEALIRCVEGMASSPLVLRILEVDPELLLPYATDRLGATQRTVLALLQDQIAEGQEDHSIRAGEPHVVAATLELAARGFIFSARAREHGCAPADAVRELRTMVDAYLMP